MQLPFAIETGVRMAGVMARRLGIVGKGAGFFLKRRINRCELPDTVQDLREEIVRQSGSGIESCDLDYEMEMLFLMGNDNPTFVEALDWIEAARYDGIMDEYTGRQILNICASRTDVDTAVSVESLCGDLRCVNCRILRSEIANFSARFAIFLSHWKKGTPD